MKLLYCLLVMLYPFVCISQPLTMKGKIIDEQGEPVVGATITIKGTDKSVVSDRLGEFTIKDTKTTDIVIVTAIGYEMMEVPNNERGLITIMLKRSFASLDEAVVIAYGTTTKRFNTGAMNEVKAEVIERQPVTNVLSAIQGRVPGLVITHSTGLPATEMKVLIRGRNSIDQGTSPLYIVDGVPFPMEDLGDENRINVNNPMNTINPADIESVVILKDADATAIYGSRGSNGVILITTKKGKPGGTKTDFSIYSSWGKAGRTMPYMNTQQYLEMRKEAYANDGLTPALPSGADLLVWDSTRYVDWLNLLTGETARRTNAQLRISGGSNNTTFYVSGRYSRGTTVYHGSEYTENGSVQFSLNHKSTNHKFAIDLTNYYGISKNVLPNDLISRLTSTSPNAPYPYDASGKLIWQEGGIAFGNPMAALLKEYEGTTDNLNLSTVVSYSIGKGLSVQTRVGYNYLSFREVNIVPIAAQNPAANPLGSAAFGTSGTKGFIVEPQIDYEGSLWKGRLKATLGGTYNRAERNDDNLDGSGYTSDAMIKSIDGAATVEGSDFYSLYKYTGLFIHLNYNLKNRYIVNLTARRDGSSRFGPDKQYANFGAVGGAWIFSQESFFRPLLCIMSFGKLRGSYGITGNDKIGDYKYLDSWASTSNPYQGTPSLIPARLFNSEYSWEQIKKIEGALELGFLKDRLFMTVNWYQSRSDNQLINYVLPAQTGFQSIIRNFPGVVENTGWEFELSGTAYKRKTFAWQTGINISFPRNKLLAFPGIENTSYASMYSVGESLGIIKGYSYKGINPVSGIYEFYDLNGDSAISIADYTNLGSFDPKFIGGLDNRFFYMGFELSFFFQFVNQIGRHGIYSIMRPGLASNMPLSVLDRWTKNGDVAKFQKYTTSTTTPAGRAASNMTNSNGSITDANFIRLSNASFSYLLPEPLLAKLRIQTCRIYVEGNNLAVFTNYEGPDPETQTINYIGPVRTMAAGIQITF